MKRKTKFPFSSPEALVAAGAAGVKFEIRRTKPLNSTQITAFAVTAHGDLLVNVGEDARSGWAGFSHIDGSNAALPHCTLCVVEGQPAVSPPSATYCTPPNNEGRKPLPWREVMSPTLTISKLQELVSLANRCFRSDCIVAGGAVRDIVHGKPVKDIDLFLFQDLPFDDWPRGDQALSEVIPGTGAFMRALHCENVAYYPADTDEMAQMGGVGSGYKYQMGHIAAMVELPSGFHMHPIQVIALYKPPREVAAKFDYGLCQCWVDARRMATTRDWQRDHDNKRFTYFPQQENKPKTARERQRRLAAKYPGWTFHGLHNLPAEVTVCSAS